MCGIESSRIHGFSMKSSMCACQLSDLKYVFSGVATWWQHCTVSVQRQMCLVFDGDLTKATHHFRCYRVYSSYL